MQLEEMVHLLSTVLQSECDKMIAMVCRKNVYFLRTESNNRLVTVGTKGIKRSCYKLHVMQES